MTEKQLFTNENHTEKYRLYRPNYPDELFDHIRQYYFDGQSNECRIPLALDVACGNGQATIALTKFCDRIIGIDVSANQIAQAIPHPHIEYRCEHAENLSFLSDHSVDLITVATALHWFDIDAFFLEVERVLKRRTGVLAVWSYNFGHLDQPEANSAYLEFCLKTLGPYWNSRGAIAAEFYRPLLDRFPYPTTRKQFSIDYRTEMTLDGFMGYLQTFSAFQTFLQEQGDEICQKILKELRDKLARCYQIEQNEDKSIGMIYSMELYLMKQI